jgi:hypothetical protein
LSLDAPRDAMDVRTASCEVRSWILGFGWPSVL